MSGFLWFVFSKVAVDVCSRLQKGANSQSAPSHKTAKNISGDYRWLEQLRGGSRGLKNGSPFAKLREIRGG